ncbi:hypothetical protein JKI95_10285 [Corynebacterium aquatimens]|uniref:hypothetical protein n=1 Tax=Corynebacterium aquatimens TaxID=1190508 RepID=UPI00253FCDE7|nr:hypothetical protein [Corynebacterium aquatimens]QYH19458.1 hypothetical protein JKI95_10285 [Corynebacterium aquatimens]
MPTAVWTTLKPHEREFLRCYAASAITHKAVLVGRSAARIAGMWVLEHKDEVVELALPSGKPPAKSSWPEGIVCRRVPVPAGDIVTAGKHGELRYTRGARTAIDVARFHTQRDGVVAFDSLFRDETEANKLAISESVTKALKRMEGSSTSRQRARRSSCPQPCPSPPLRVCSG